MTVVVDLPVSSVEIDGDTGTTSIIGPSGSVEVTTPAAQIGLGVPGPQGPPGRGSVWWSGDGPPGVIPNAAEGDMYLDNLNGDVYWLEMAEGELPPSEETYDYGESDYGTGPYGGI